ncbi:MAG: TetR family transcriptional regulator [Candidatus Dormibacteria bacterium]
MTSSEPGEDRQPGLRERKKAKTRAVIQQEAMRLFRERGYDGATVEDIAEAAEVSPSTFFRYFPTKEDVVLRDDYDDLLIEAFLAQPPDLPPLRAFREALHGIVGFAAELSPDELELEQVRMSLSFTQPEVRARWINEFARAFRSFGTAVAQRAGLPADDLRVSTFVGALFGVVLVAFEPILEDPARRWIDFLPAIDDALDLLEQGLPL